MLNGVRKAVALIWTDRGAALPTAKTGHRGTVVLKRNDGVAADLAYLGLYDSAGAPQLRQLLTKEIADTTYEPLVGTVTRSMAPVLDNTGAGIDIVHSLTHGYQEEGDTFDIEFDANAAGSWALYTTLATIGDDAGWDLGATNPFNLRTNWAPLSVEWRVQTGSTLTTVLFWIGCFSSTPMASPNPAIDGFGFRYDSGADATAFWRCWSNDGVSTGTNTTTTMAIAANTVYAFRVDVVSTASIRFFINDTLVATHTTNLPTATVNLVPQCKVRALANSVRVIRWAWFRVKHT